jgi:hydroxymethylbilane synthase
LRRLATRGSALALAQATLALQQLRALDPQLDVELCVIDSDGDLNPDQAVPELAGQGWFSSRLERALLDGRADAAVHSAKDLPTTMSPGLAVGAYLQREDPRDCVVTRSGGPWADLPAGARLGTSSPRRAAQLMALRSDLVPTPVRGNVDTRIRRMGERGLEAVVIAQAGLRRLGRGEEGQPLDPHHQCTPAPAQGTIAIQIPSDSPLAALVAKVDDPCTRLCAEAEREVLLGFGGGCRLPLGVLAEPWGEGLFRITVAWSADGTGGDLVRRFEVVSADALIAAARKLARELAPPA